MRRIIVGSKTKSVVEVVHYAAGLSQTLERFGYKGVEVAPVTEFYPNPRTSEHQKHDGDVPDFYVAIEKTSGVVWEEYDPTLLEFARAVERWFLAHQKVKTTAAPHVADPIPSQCDDFTGQGEGSATAPGGPTSLCLTEEIGRGPSGTIPTSLMAETILGEVAGLQ